MTHQHTGRSRGGQPGNHNHLVHGIYSKQVSLEDNDPLETMPSDLTEQELALARIRLKTCIEKQQGAAPQEWPAYERIIAHYLKLIASLIQKNASLNKGDARKDAVAIVMDYIRQENELQHVQ
jgi:hypothetical protein